MRRNSGLDALYSATTSRSVDSPPAAGYTTSRTAPSGRFRLASATFANSAFLLRTRLNEATISSVTRRSARALIVCTVEISNSTSVSVISRSRSTSNADSNRAIDLLRAMGLEEVRPAQRQGCRTANRRSTVAAPRSHRPAVPGRGRRMTACLSESASCASAKPMRLRFDSIGALKPLPANNSSVHARDLGTGVLPEKDRAGSAPPGETPPGVRPSMGAWSWEIGEHALVRLEFMAQCHRHPGQGVEGVE